MQERRTGSFSKYNVMTTLEEKNILNAVIEYLKNELYSNKLGKYIQPLIKMDTYRDYKLDYKKASDTKC